MSQIRVVLPYHLRNLARIEGDLMVEVDGIVTPNTILNRIEADYPMLKGTIREYVTGRRRAWLRFFACQEDISHEPMDSQLPNAISTGNEPFIIIGAIAGG